MKNVPGRQKEKGTLAAVLARILSFPLRRTRWAAARSLFVVRAPMSTSSNAIEMPPAQIVRAHCIRRPSGNGVLVAAREIVALGMLVAAALSACREGADQTCAVAGRKWGPPARTAGMGATTAARISQYDACSCCR